MPHEPVQSSRKKTRHLDHTLSLSNGIPQWTFIKKIPKHTRYTRWQKKTELAHSGQYLAAAASAKCIARGLDFTYLYIHVYTRRGEVKSTAKKAAWRRRHIQLRGREGDDKMLVSCRSTRASTWQTHRRARERAPGTPRWCIAPGAYFSSGEFIYSPGERAHADMYTRARSRESVWVQQCAGLSVRGRRETREARKERMCAFENCCCCCRVR